MPAKGKSRWAPGATALADASRALTDIVFNGRSADAALAPFATSTERSAVRAITLGSTRWYLRLAPAIECLLARPDGVALEVRALLVAAAHQIEYSRNPQETTANAAVDATRVLQQPRAASLVNAVLRRFVADRGVLLAKGDPELTVRTAHPRWLVEALQRTWPNEAVSILEANNAHPPMTLRVDTSRTSTLAYLAELEAAGMQATAVGEWAPAAVHLAKPVSVSALPGFKEGRVSVQDAGAQLAAELLDAQSGMRVLDACAAPGGKTGHILERVPDLADVLAVDIDRERLARVGEGLKRMGRSARQLMADLRDPAALQAEPLFDRVLLDAPCSATGVIRRHPDIKLLRRPEDINALAATQRAILEAVFARLVPGGRLVYSTCSVLASENAEIVRDFLQRHPQARAVGWPQRIKPPGMLDLEVGWQLLPGKAAGTDGFYYACLEKTTSIS